MQVFDFIGNGQIKHEFIKRSIDFLSKEIVNEDILFRLERLAEDTVMVADAFAEIREKKDAEYDF